MEDKVYKIGKQILKEHDLEFTVDYGGEIFTLKHPAPFQKALIEVDIANRLGGNPRTAFPIDHVNMVEASCYISSIIVSEKSPSWFSNAWTCFDEQLIATLYTGYLRFRSEFQEKLRKGGFQGSS